MRRRVLFFGLLTLLCVAGAELWLYWPRLFPQGEPSSWFLHFEHNPSVQVEYITCCRINDTLSIDCTVIRALDEAGWNEIAAYFGFPERLIKDTMVENSLSLKYLRRNDEIVDSHFDAFDKDLAVFSEQRRMATIYHVRNKKQVETILDIQFQNLKQKPKYTQ